MQTWSSHRQTSEATQEDYEEKHTYNYKHPVLIKSLYPSHSISFALCIYFYICIYCMHLTLSIVFNAFNMKFFRIHIFPYLSNYVITMIVFTLYTFLSIWLNMLKVSNSLKDPEKQNKSLI